MTLFCFVAVLRHLMAGLEWHIQLLQLLLLHSGEMDITMVTVMEMELVKVLAKVQVLSVSA